MKKRKSIKLRQTLTLDLSRSNREIARRFVNKEHTGSESVPLDKEVSAALREAHFTLNMSQEIEVTIRLYSDGRFVLV